MHKTPRQRRREATLQRIEDRALQLIVEGGFDALTIHRLAKDLDFTPGALYRYFSSKEELIDTLTVRVVSSFVRVVEQVRGDVSDDGVLVQIAAMLRVYGQLATHAPNRFGLISMMMAEPRLLLPDATEASPSYRSVMHAMASLASSLEAASRQGALRPGASLDRAVVAFSTVHGLLQLRKQSRRMAGVLDMDRLFAEAVCTLLIGWGADPSAARLALQTTDDLGDLIARSGGLS